MSSKFDKTMRIAMWSGPRNLSTALMYSFAARSDAKVVDEPFYACYLQKTGLIHPMRDEILASQPIVPEDVVDTLLAPIAEPVYYQKHMAHHMVAGIPTDWMQNVTNVYLIRHPDRVVASYARKRESPSLQDLGFADQFRLFSENPGPVIDCDDILAAPERVLSALCAQIGLSWDPAMLAWPPGGNAADGIWARHWYGAVHRSSGFEAGVPEMPKLEPDYAALAAEALPIYEEMAAKRFIPSDASAQPEV